MNRGELSPPREVAQARFRCAAPIGTACGVAMDPQGGGMSGFVPPGDCPTCGEPVPAGARACPHCGADERTGWNEETYLDGVDLPEEDDLRLNRGRPEGDVAGGLPRGGRAWLAFGVAVLLALILSGAWWLLH